MINTLVFKEDNKTFYYSIIAVSTIKYDDNIHIQFYTNKDMYSVQIFFDEYKDFKDYYIIQRLNEFILYEFHICFDTLAEDFEEWLTHGILSNTAGEKGD